MGVDLVFRIIRVMNGGYVVKDGFHDNVFASTRVDEALMFIRDKMRDDPLKSKPANLQSGLPRGVLANPSSDGTKETSTII